MIQAEFVATLVEKLKPNGLIHVATDWQNYAEHIADVLIGNSDLSNTATAAQESPYVEKPAYRPLTKYEARGQRLGHGVWDLVFKKNS